MKIQDPSGRLARWAIYMQGYDFEIIHRPGRLHSNVDALSRPIMALEIDKPEMRNDQNISSSDLDPYQDGLLTFYLKNGNFEPGSSENQRKRILKIADHFKWDNEIIWYSKDITKDEFKEIPKEEKRISIIQKHHTVGHFGITETARRISQKYYWRNMYKDVEAAIHQCLPCCRFGRRNTLEHPALSIKVDSIFDRVAMDLVNGLPKSTKGNKTLVIITDCFSKFLYGAAIKTKQATEVANQLYIFICLYGAPKELLTDQGTEFLNSTVTALNESAKIKHIITSAYNPKANGLAEKTNRSTIEGLSKLANESQENWDEILPFYVRAHNSRVSTTTKFSPNMLIFGREMNELDDWTGEEDTSANLNLCLNKRTQEIKRQYEQYLTKARTNIDTAQLYQREYRDQHNHVIKEKLNPGTVVYLKTPGLLVKGKLDERYFGPYTIHATSTQGNYWLLNEDHVLLKNSYPITKLKIIENVSEKEPEIEEILKVRTKNKKREYLVKWNNKEETVWLAEEKFNNIEILNEFLLRETTNLEDDEEKAGQLNKPKAQVSNRPKRNTKTKKPDLALALIVIFGLLISCCAEKEVTGHFKYCKTSFASPLVVNDKSCKNQEEPSFGTEKMMSILEKMKYNINGDGYACKQTKRIHKLTYHWYLAQSKIENEIDVELSREDCLLMILGKKCEHQKMNCMDDDCHIDYRPNEYFSYGSELEFIGFTCRTKKIEIFGKDVNTKLFKEASTSCLAKDLFCQINELTIVWQREIIHQCPYQVVQRIKLNISGNILSSEDQNLLFQKTGEKVDCNVTMIETSEGLFITETEIESKIGKSQGELKEMHQFMIADLDFKIAVGADRTTALINKVNLHNCQIMQMLIKAFGKQYNKFIIVSDLTGNEVVLFNNDGLIMIADCTSLERVTLLETMTECYEQPQITFVLNDTKYIASLFEDGILSNNKNIHLDCNKRTITKIPNNRAIVITKNKTSKLIVIDNEIKDLSIVLWENYKIDFKHPDLLKEDVDLFEKLNKVIQLKELNDHYYFMPEIQSEGNSSEEIARNIEKGALAVAIMLATLKTGMVIIGIIILIYLILKYILVWRRNQPETTSQLAVQTPTTIRFNAPTERLELATENMESLPLVHPSIAHESIHYEAQQRDEKISELETKLKTIN